MQAERGDPFDISQKKVDLVKRDDALRGDR